LLQHASTQKGTLFGVRKEGKEQVSNISSKEGSKIATGVKRTAWDAVVGEDSAKIKKQKEDFYASDPRTGTELHSLLRRKKKKTATKSSWADMRAFWNGDGPISDRNGRAKSLREGLWVEMRNVEFSTCRNRTREKEDKEGGKEVQKPERPPSLGGTKGHSSLR